MKKDCPHAKHRQRLREKVKSSGIKALADHEILEWLLIHTIPRKDTNVTGHNLMNKFGSLSHVFEASYLDLTKVEGVGPESALLLSSILPILDAYHKSKSNRPKKDLRTIADCIEYYRQHTIIKHREIFSVMCLNSQNKIIKLHNIAGEDCSTVNFNSKELFNQINVPEVTTVLLFHTHPGGDVYPSDMDIKTTREIMTMCKYAGIKVKDHVILNETQHFSFASNDIIQQLEDIINDKLENAPAIKIKGVIKNY